MSERERGWMSLLALVEHLSVVVVVLWELVVLEWTVEYMVDCTV